MNLDTDKFAFRLSILYYVNGQRKYYTSNDTFFRLEISQIIKTYNSSGFTQFEPQEIGYSNWYSQSESSEFKIQQALICLNSSDYELKGGTGTFDHRSLKVTLEQWK